MQLNTNSKKVLIIDLARQTYEAKTFSDLQPYIGGVGLGLKLFQQFKKESPLIFSVGPLNGFFPFVSKTAIILDRGGFAEDIYMGGALSTRLAFTGVDALVFLGKAMNKTIVNTLDESVHFYDENVDLGSLGLPGKRVVLYQSVLDKYFSTPQNLLFETLHDKNLESLVITGTNVYDLKNNQKYSELYTALLNKASDLSVSASDKPSCSNCPMGCDFSQDGEIGGNVLLHSLVGCKFAEKIYADLGIIFSCLNVLGYSYTHEDLEKLPKLIEETINEIHNS